jgi:hypothetical protein
MVMARKAIKLRQYKKKKERRKKNETRRALISPSFILAMLFKLHSFDDERSSSQEITYSTKEGS